MNGQPLIADILLKMMVDIRTCICLRLLPFYLAISVSCNAYQNIRTDNWGITTPYIHKVNYIWTIDDWLTGPSQMEENPILMSPYFSPPSAPEYKLQLIMYPQNTVFPEYVVVKFIYVSGPLSAIYNDVEFAVLDTTCKSVLTVKVRESDGKENMYKIAERKWFVDNADTVLTNSGQLRLAMSTEIRHTNCSCDNRCKTPAVVEPAQPANCTCDNKCEKPAVVEPAQPANCTCDNKCPKPPVTQCFLYKYANNQNFSDATFQTSDGKTKPVHKILLAAQSVVLANAYKTSNTFKSTDIDMPTLTEVICYLYCGKPHYLDTLANKLLIAAKSLKIDGLKKICEAHLGISTNATKAN